MGQIYKIIQDRQKNLRQNASFTSMPSWPFWVLVILISIALSAPAFAMGGEKLWSRTNVVAGKQEAKAMAVDSAGNTIVVGYTDSNANDYYVVKFNADGSGTAWAPVTFGGVGEDVATAVTVDSANNIIVTGYTWNGSDRDIHTIKYDGATGAVLWQHTLTNTSGNDSAAAVAVDGSDNIYVAGSYFNGAQTDDFVVIKYPSAGAVPTWTEIFDDSANPNKINKILAMAVNSTGLAVTGYSGRGATFDMLTRKYALDKSFIRQWRHSDSGDCMGKAVRMDVAGNVIVTGSSMNAQNNTDIYTAKYDPASDTPVWEKTYNGNSTDDPTGLWVDSAGYVYVTGITNTLAGNDDFFTARYDGANGDLKWKAIFDAGNDATDIPDGIVVDEALDGGVFVTGYSTVSGNDDFLTLKYKKDDGTLLWEEAFTGSDNKNDRPIGIALEPAGGAVPGSVYVAGWSDSTATSYNFEVVKYDFGALNAPTGLTAAAASDTSITLTWKDNSINEDKFVIQRKLGEGGTFVDITTVPSPLPADTVTYTDTGLTANNYYYYRVRAWNSDNDDSDHSNEARALTKVVSYTAPSWSYLYDGGLDDIATAITIDSDNHPVVTGYSDLTEEGVEDSFSYDYMTFKLDRDNNALKWKARYDSGDGGTDQAAGVALDSSGNVLVTGTAYLAGGGDKSDDLYTRKVATAGLNDPAVEPGLLWDHQYGTLNGIDLATAIAMVRDGSNNSVVIGHGGNSSVPQDDDTFIVKYANDGTRPWTPIIYDSGRNDLPTAVAFDASGNIFVTGYSYDKTADPSGSFDWFTNKYNGTTGAIIWSDVFDSGFGADKALSIDVDKAGNAYVSGYAKNSAGNFVFHTIKYDGALVPAGARRIWSASYNKTGLDARAVSVKVDPIDGEVVVGGTAYMSATDSDFRLIRYNPADGSEIWNRNFDRAGYDYATAMTMDASGYIYLAGNTRAGLDTDTGFDASSDVLSLIYDYEGTYLGAMTYDKSALQDETLAITVNYRGEAFIAGFASIATDNTDYIVLKQTNPYLLVPGPFTATAQADYTKIDLAWQVPASGPSFKIFRTLGPSSPLSVWTLISSPAAGQLAYTDTTASLPGTSYCYTIEAISGSLNSRKTETCVTNRLQKPTLEPLTVDSPTQITLNWDQVAGNTGYKIERKIGAGAWADLTTKPTDVNFHVDSGLSPGTTYYYRVSTNSAVGYSLASNEPSAITKPAAPAMAANGTITTTSVTINWTNVVGETGYKIERKEGAGGAWSQITTRTTDVLTYIDNTPPLTFNTQYYYRVRAYNASGDSDYSSEQGGLTLFTPTTLTSATSVSQTQVDMVWADVAGETGYSVQEAVCNRNNQTIDITYCTAAYINNTSYWPTWTTINSPGVDVLTYSRTGRTSGYAYAYRIIANTTGNSSAPSNAIIAWTYLTAPVLTISPASETSLLVSWNNINGTTNYTLERKEGADGTWAEVTGAIGMGADVVTKTDTGLSLSTEYCYRVKAYSTLPNNPPDIYSNAPCLFTPLAAPVQNAPTGITTTQVDLSWSNVAGNTGYELQRCQFTQLTTPQNATNPTYLNNDSYWNNCSTIATLAADTITYQNIGLTSGYTYRYKLRDTYDGGYSAWSNAQPVTTIPPTPTLNAPTSPSTSQISLSWNSMYGETGFRLEWKERSGADCSAGSWNTPINISQNATTYNHTSRSAGTWYCYRLYATNSSGDSGYSIERSQTTLAVPPTLDAPSGVTAAQAVLTWNNVAGNTSYKLERKIGAAGAWGTLVTTAADAVTYTNTGLTAGTLYYYRISTNNNAGSSVASNEVSTTTTPVAPTVTTTVVSAEQIDISWPVKLGATNYKIERKEGAGSYSQIDNVTVTYVENYCGYDYPTVACPSLSASTTLYQNSGLTENTTYCYQLKSWNSTGGDSAYSTEECATTSAMPLQNLTATALDGGFRIRLDWTAIVCLPIACDAPTGYELQRQVRDGNWVLLKTLDGATLTYTDGIAIDPGKQYRYRVRSVSGEDKSPYSEAMVYAKPYSEEANVCTEN